MTTSVKTGGEVDAMCNKCKLVLAHTILAMVGTKIARVKCNTCGSEHAYRGTAAPAKKKPRAKSGDKPAKVILSFAQQIEGKDVNKAKKYSPRATFAPGDLIDHPTFGLGIVNVVRDEKIDVAFKAEEKTLVHGRIPPGESAPVEAPAASAPPAPTQPPQA
jgi:hypothetical protein